VGFVLRRSHRLARSRKGRGTESGYCPWLMKMSKAPQVSAKINTIAKYSNMSPPSRGFDCRDG
jgi:hypothetical protein